MARRIDAHHHLWKYSQQEYGWIATGMDAIARDFTPEDLRCELHASGFDGSIAVQARQSVEETEWLLKLADDTDYIEGVVGWAPLASPDLSKILERWKTRGKLKGLRHIIQDEADDEFILRPDFNAAITRLAGTNLVYDILIYEKHLPAAIKFLDLHPNQIFVLDHIAKPRIRDGILEPWRSALTELAKRENVYCKISGMVTEAHWKNWKSDDLRPYLDTVLQAFGPKRLMFGSDWPVCLLACSYQKWHQTLLALLTQLSPCEKEQIFGAVATKVYSLNSKTP